MIGLLVLALYMMLELGIASYIDEYCENRAKSVVRDQWNKNLEPNEREKSVRLTYQSWGYREKATCEESIPFHTPLLYLLNWLAP